MSYSEGTALMLFLSDHSLSRAHKELAGRIAAGYQTEIGGV